MRNLAGIPERTPELEGIFIDFPASLEDIRHADATGTSGSFWGKAVIRSSRLNDAGCRRILLKKSVNLAAAVSLRGIKLAARRLLSRYRWSLMVFKSGSAPFVLRKFSQVLSNGCEQELVSSAAGATQAQPVEFENALEMGKQHLDFFPLAA